MFHKLIDSIDTTENFRFKRQELARKLWLEMASTNARECRNCYHFDAMDTEKQKKLAMDLCAALVKKEVKTVLIVI